MRFISNRSLNHDLESPNDVRSLGGYLTSRFDFWVLTSVQNINSTTQACPVIEYV